MHLENSETCPACMDQLTLETLRPTSGIVANALSELSESPCRHVSRGCVENVEIADVLLHEQTCGYAPVVCSNEGCKETVNRRSQERHETKECKFRKITCGEESNKQSCGQDRFPCTCSRVNSGVNSVVTNGAEIFIFGGGDEDAIHTSFEVCNWSTKTWTLVENSLIFHRFWSFSFIYGKKIVICGGIPTERIEYLNPSESGYTATVASLSLSNDAKYNGLLYKDRILTFYKGVVETLLESPGESRILLQEEQCRDCCGVHLFEDNVYIVGGRESKMEKYDVVKNEMKTLPSLPYKVSEMARTKIT